MKRNSLYEWRLSFQDLKCSEVAQKKVRNDHSLIKCPHIAVLTATRFWHKSILTQSILTQMDSGAKRFLIKRMLTQKYSDTKLFWHILMSDTKQFWYKTIPTQNNSDTKHKIDFLCQNFLCVLCQNYFCPNKKVS